MPAVPRVPRGSHEGPLCRFQVNQGEITTITSSTVTSSTSTFTTATSIWIAAGMGNLDKGMTRRMGHQPLTLTVAQCLNVPAMIPGMMLWIIDATWAILPSAFIHRFSQPDWVPTGYRDAFMCSTCVTCRRATVGKYFPPTDDLFVNISSPLSQFRSKISFIFSTSRHHGLT